MPNHNNTIRCLYTSARTVPRQWFHLYCYHCHHNKCHTQCFIITSRLRLGWSGFRYLARANHFSFLQNVLSASGTHPGSVHCVLVILDSEVKSPVVRLTTDLNKMQRLRTSGAISLLVQCAFMASTRKASLCLVCIVCVCLHFLMFFLVCLSYCIVPIVAACCHTWYRTFTDIWLTRF